MDDTLPAPTPTPTADLPTAPGSTFLVAVEILLWSFYTIAFIMVMVVYMLN